MCAPINGRSGPVGAHPKEGALLERWLAQCGRTGTTIHDRLIVRIRQNESRLFAIIVTVVDNRLRRQ